ncbi:MAG: thioredoxin [Lachnospiraceae bacterium]
MAEVKLTKENFEEVVLKSDKPVLVDFWATWCGPCRMIAPIVEELAKEYEGRAVVGKVNVDEETELAVRYGVVSIPTVLLFKNGNVTGKIVGYVPKNELEELLK